MRASKGILLAVFVVTLTIIRGTEESEHNKVCDDESEAKLFILNGLRQQHAIKEIEINKLLRNINEAEISLTELLTRLNSTRNEANELQAQINVTTHELAGLQICLDEIFTDCCQIKRKFPSAHSGIYAIKDPCSGDNPFSYAKLAVYCDMETAGGGWIVIQRRDANMRWVNFARGWVDYKNGFGDLDGEFWIGLKQIYELTNQQRFELNVRVQGRDYQYPYFRILDESKRYALFITRNYWDDNNMIFGPYEGDYYYFTTFDRYYGHNCGYTRQSGWWYYYGENCDVNANLNGRHQPSGLSGIDGVGERLVLRIDHDHDYSIETYSDMMIRPQSCEL